MTRQPLFHILDLEFDDVVAHIRTDRANRYVYISSRTPKSLAPGSTMADYERPEHAVK